MKKWGLFMAALLLLLNVQVQQAQDSDTYIAFVSNREENDDIFVTNQDGTVVYNLTQSRSRNWHPTWSGDGTRIAYNSNQDENIEIYVMNANGTGKINVSNYPAGDTSPDWSPVSDEIAFISDRDGGYDLYVLDLDANTTRRLTEDGAPKSEPDWSPDGTQIAFWQQVESAYVLNVLSVSSGEVTTLIDSGQNQWPAWSPDGSTIAFFSAASGNADVFTVDVASGEITNLTNSTFNSARADWSPDGSHLVFITDEDGNFNLYVMNADGSGKHRLTDASQNDESPAWQPFPAPIDYDPSSLGLNVNVVQGNVSADAQEELGAGSRRLFAPEVANVSDVIRVRFEIEVDDAEMQATPGPTPDIPLRDEAALTVYRFMGAELTGLDLGRFDVFPNPTGYVLQISEDSVNYWEWMLRPKGNDTLGTNFLAVQLYLPEVQDDGAIIRTSLEVIPFDVEVINGEPEVASAYVQDSLEPAEKNGWSVFYSDQDVLSLVFSNAIDVSDMKIATDGIEFPVLGDFPIFTQADNQVPANTCLYYELSGVEPVLPRACRAGTAYNFPLVAGEIFWYDANGRQLRDVIIRKDERVFICPAGSDRCDF